MRDGSRSGCAGFGIEAEHLSVGAEQRHLQQPRALAAPLHRGREFARQLLDTAQHIRFQPDRFGETLLGRAGRHRQTRRDRFLLAPEGLIDPAQETRTEPRGERRARARRSHRGYVSGRIAPARRRSRRPRATPRAAAFRARQRLRLSARSQCRRNAPPPRRSRRCRPRSALHSSPAATAAAPCRAAAPLPHQTDARSRKCPAATRPADRGQPAACSGRTNRRPLRAARDRRRLPHCAHRCPDASRAHPRAASRNAEPAARPRR